MAIKSLLFPFYKINVTNSNSPILPDFFPTIKKKKFQPPACTFLWFMKKNLFK